MHQVKTFFKPEQAQQLINQVTLESQEEPEEERWTYQLQQAGHYAFVIVYDEKGEFVGYF